MSGWCNGIGIAVANSTGVTLQSLIANGRTTGVYVENTGALTVQNLTADGNQTYGLRSGPA